MDELREVGHAVLILRISRRHTAGGKDGTLAAVGDDLDVGLGRVGLPRADVAGEDGRGLPVVLGGGVEPCPDLVVLRMHYFKGSATKASQTKASIPPMAALGHRAQRSPKLHGDFVQHHQGTFCDFKIISINSKFRNCKIADESNHIGLCLQRLQALLSDRSLLQASMACMAMRLTPQQCAFYS